MKFTIVSMFIAGIAFAQPNPRFTLPLCQGAVTSNCIVSSDNTGAVKVPGTLSAGGAVATVACAGTDDTAALQAAINAGAAANFQTILPTGVCVATVPLAVWKLVDIGIWLAGHVSVH